jgi:hypothetical protein
VPKDIFFTKVSTNQVYIKSNKRRKDEHSYKPNRRVLLVGNQYNTNQFEDNISHCGVYDQVAIKEKEISKQGQD